MNKMNMHSIQLVFRFSMQMDMLCMGTTMHMNKKYKRSGCKRT